MARHHVGRRFAVAKNSIPRHVGFIPDGNRRWAVDHGLPKEAGYAHGINPGLLLFEKCKECGIKEASIYCFTQDNTSRVLKNQVVCWSYSGLGLFSAGSMPR